MKIGFVGLGNVGSKLAGSLLRNGYEVMVRDLNPDFVNDFVSRGASAAESPKQLAQTCDIVITCLPSPAACSAVMEGTSDVEGVIEGLSGSPFFGAMARGCRYFWWASILPSPAFGSFWRYIAHRSMKTLGR